MDVFFGASNPFDLEADFGIDERDITHRFIFQGTVELPAGFTLSGIVNARSGRPAAAYTTQDADGDNQQTAAGNNNDHAVLNGELLPRFPFRQPKFFNTNIRVMWTGDLGESGGNIDVLFEVFNLFNNENLETRIYTVELSNFLEPTTFMGTQRTAQIGVKYRFGQQ